MAGQRGGGEGEAGKSRERANHGWDILSEKRILFQLKKERKRIWLCLNINVRDLYV